MPTDREYQDKLIERLKGNPRLSSLILLHKDLLIKLHDLLVPPGTSEKADKKIIIQTELAIAYNNIRKDSLSRILGKFDECSEKIIKREKNARSSLGKTGKSISFNDKWFENVGLLKDTLFVERLKAETESKDEENDLDKENKNQSNPSKPTKNKSNIISSHPNIELSSIPRTYLKDLLNRWYDTVAPHFKSPYWYLPIDPEFFKYTPYNPDNLYSFEDPDYNKDILKKYFPRCYNIWENEFKPKVREFYNRKDKMDQKSSEIFVEELKTIVKKLIEELKKYRIQYY